MFRTIVPGPMFGMQRTAPKFGAAKDDFILYSIKLPIDPTLSVNAGMKREDVVRIRKERGIALAEQLKQLAKEEKIESEIQKIEMVSAAGNLTAVCTEAAMKKLLEKRPDLTALSDRPWP